MKRLTLLSAIVPLMMLSCSTDDQEGAAIAPKNSNAVEFTLGGISSKVANNEFETNDYISVQALTADGTEFKHAIYKYNGEKFASEEPITITGADIDAGTEYAYKALYPQVGTFANSFDFTIKTVQNENDGYELSDLLVASVAKSSSLSPELKFEHTMSNVIIDVVFTSNGVETTKTISDFKINALNVAECNIDNDTFAGKGEKVDITPAGSGTSFNAIIAPQSLAIDGGFASLTVDGVTVTMLNSAAQDFLSGKKYTIKWTIDIVTQAQSVELTTTIGTWEDGIWTSDPTPAITVFDPTSLTFTDSETTGKDVTVTVTDQGEATLSAQSNGSHFTTSVKGTTVTVTPAEANTGVADIVETITVSVDGGNSLTFDATHSKPEGSSGGGTTYPVTLDLSTAGKVAGNYAVLESGGALMTVSGCSIEFFCTLVYNHNNAPVYFSVGTVLAVKYTLSGTTTFVISSTSPMTTIKFNHYLSNGNRKLDASFSAGTGSIATGTGDDLGPIWTSGDSNTTSVTFTVTTGNCMIKAVEIN